MKKRLIAFCMAFFMVVTAVFAGSGMTFPGNAASVRAAGDNEYAGYVYFTAEKITLGQGFVIQPVKVGFYEDDTLADITQRALGDKSGYQGEVTSSYYLESVLDGGEPEDWTKEDIPGKIREAVTAEGGSLYGREQADRLSAFDYYGDSGWMFALNDKGISAGAGNYVYEEKADAGDTYTFADGDVVRLQFTVYGYGADTDICDPSWGTEPLLTFSSKDDLIKLVADYTDDVNADAYVQAMQTLEDWDATDAEITAACKALQTPLASDTDATEEDTSEVTTEEPTTEELVEKDVQVTITMNALSVAMTMTDSEGNPVEVGTPENKVYNLELKPGDYIITGIGTDGTTVNGTIGITVTEEESQSFTIFTVTAYCSTSGWSYDTDYTIEDLTVNSSDGVIRENVTMGTHTTNAARKTFLVLKGDSYGFYFTPVGDRAADYAVVYQQGTVTFNATKSFAAAAKRNLTVTIPYADENGDQKNDYELEVGTLSSYFIYSYMEPVAVTVDEDTETASFLAANGVSYFYRVRNPWNEDAVTYGNYTSSLKADTDVTVTTADLYVDVSEGTDYDRTTVVRDMVVNSYDVADIYLNANETGCINLDIGDTYTLYPLRNWLAIESISNSKVIEPDFHYTVLDVNGNLSSDVISITENTTNTTSKHSAVIQAKGEGTAIVLVSYDAMINAQGYACSNPASADRTFFSAIWPENTGVIVVNVGQDGTIDTGMTIHEGMNTSTKLSADAIDAECDVLYYLDEDGAEYTFIPEDGVTVKTAVPVISGNSLTYQGFTDANVETDADGSVTVSGLVEGPNIIELTKGDIVTYQVIRAKKLDYTVTAVDADGNAVEASEIIPGDTVTVTFDTVYHPANKTSGYYNFSAQVVYDAPDGTQVKGTANQYVFAATEKAQQLTFTIPADYEDSEYTLTDGYIYCTGFGSPAGDHRSVTYERGKSANFTAVMQKIYLCELPDITISTDYKKVTVCAYDYTAVAAGLEGASETGIILEDTVLVPKDADAAETVRTAFEKNGIEISGLEQGYVSSIHSLTAAAGGGYSGWYMSYNNDDYSNYGLSYINVEDGDTIRFDYSVNPDMNTDDIGNGFYGLPIVTSLTLEADSEISQTVTMSRTGTYDNSGNLVSTYYVDGVETACQGTKEDPFVLEFELPWDVDITELDTTYTLSLNENYAVFDGIEAVNDYSDGLDFTVSSLGGHYVSYYHVIVEIQPNPASDEYEEVLKNTVDYIAKTVNNPVVYSIGGEWAVVALARYGYENNQWYHTYYENVLETIAENGSNQLSTTKSTENSRVIIGLSAIGADPSDIGEYDLFEPLSDLDYVKQQGINGAIFALIAFDTNAYEIPEADASVTNPTTREALIQYILSRELENGGWALKGQTADVDITAMAIQSLAPYYNTDEDIRAAVDRGLVELSKLQQADGSFIAYEEKNAESTAQVITALCALGKNPEEEPAFIKNGNSAVDALLTFYDETTHSFCHTTESDEMATEQAAYALVAYDRLLKEQNRLYDMTDAEVIYIGDIQNSEITLSATSFVCDGTEKKPTVTVIENGRTLKENIDYTVSYKNNLNAGTASVIITGIGSHTGEVTKTFKMTLATPVLKSISNAETGVKVTWDQVPGASGYLVYRKEPGKSYERIATLTSGTTVQYTDATATGGTTYIYTVRANGNSGLSGYVQDGISIKYMAKPDLTSITNTSTGIRITWTKVTGASGYAIYRKSKNGPYERIATLTSANTLQYTDTTTLSGTTYTYTVRGYDGSTLGSYKEAGITLRYVAEPAVAVNNVDTGIQVRWTRRSGATGFLIYRKAGNSTTWTRIATITDGNTVSYIDTDVTDGTKYTYTVRVVSLGTLSSYRSGETTCRLSTQSIKSLNSSSGKLRVTWNALSSATGYQVQWSTSAAMTNPSIKSIQDRTVLSYDISVTSGKTYYVRIRNYKTVDGVIYYGAWSSVKSISVP